MVEYTHMNLAVGRGVAQPVSCLCLTADTWAQSGARVCGICGEQNGIDRGFTQSTITITILTLLHSNF